MGNRRGKLDMAHALTTHLGLDDLDAAFFTDNAAIFHALVFAAEALIVLNRSEYPSSEQTVALGLKGPIVDRFWLFYLAIRPRSDLFRTGNRDSNLVELLRRTDRAEQIDQLTHELSPLTPIRGAGMNRPKRMPRPGIPT